MRSVAVLVDGGFYLQRYRQYFPEHKYDARRVAKDLLNHCLKHIYNKSQKSHEKQPHERELERLYRIFFYDCPPHTKKVHHPITGDSMDLGQSKQAIFRNELHKQLKQTRNLALRMGELSRHARWKIKEPDKERKFIAGEISEELTASDVIYYAPQKGVDMKIGLDIASLAYKKLVDKLVLISGDSDFVPAAKFARREGIEFILDPMHANINPDLQEHIDGLITTLPGSA